MSQHRDEAWLETYQKRTGLAVPGLTRAEPPAPPPKPARSLSKPEAKLQADVVGWLEQNGYTVWEMYKGSTRGGSVWATKGIPDLYILGWGWIELKSESGVISLEQYERHLELRAKFERVIVATSLEEVIREVKGSKGDELKQRLERYVRPQW